MFTRLYLFVCRLRQISLKSVEETAQLVKKVRRGSVGARIKGYDLFWRHCHQPMQKVEVLLCGSSGVQPALYDQYVCSRPGCSFSSNKIPSASDM